VRAVLCAAAAIGDEFTRAEENLETHTQKAQGRNACAAPLAARRPKMPKEKEVACEKVSIYSN
jgi:hypothetical protein